jgi:hypothetical protein
MSQLMAMGVFRQTQEIYQPSVKRMYVNNATNLATNGWFG